MKMKHTTKMVCLPRVLALVAALVLPGVALASNADSAHAKDTAGVGHAASAGVDPVRFNTIDGQPIHYTIPSPSN